MKINGLKRVMLIAMCALFLIAAFETEAATRTNIKKMVIAEASNSDVPPALALALAKVESDFNRNALSTAGARGVMQIMPKTAEDEFGVGADELWDAKLNIQLGIGFLSQLHKQYGGSWELALSHYNGGTLSKRGNRAVPHSYTRAYVAAVMRWWQRYEDQSTVWKLASVENIEETNDGWAPALTKVRKKRAERRKARRIDRRKNRWNRRNYRRYGASGRTRITTSWGSRYDRFDDDQDSLDLRRKRARDELDDFGPSHPWRKG